MNNTQVIRATVKEIIDLSTKSAILADKKSNVFCEQYTRLNDSNEFLKALCTDHGLKTDRLSSYINSLASNQPIRFKYANFEKLNQNLKPEYYSLFQNLGRVKNGVSTLVKIRQDLLDMLEKKNSTEQEEDLKIMNSILKNLLTLWFSTGLLNIQQITWNSPTSLVEKVAHYESVHQIRTLNDLKSRLSASRRCFIYTHSTMPYEPLVILHIALTKSISSNIHDVLKSSESTHSNELNEYTNAIFYSINSCQKGLQQVDLGNALIKSCVRLLIEQMPSLCNFHTLSPIPKFREWLDLKISTYSAQQSQSKEYFNLEQTLTPDETALLLDHFKLSNQTKDQLFINIRQVLNSNEFRMNNPSDDNLIHKTIGLFVQRACAFYLYYEKKNGYAFNSVANFHLKNGAQIYRINFKGNLSENGWRSSYGMMVNYGYYLDRVDSNCINYLINKQIVVSDLVRNDLSLFKI